MHKLRPTLWRTCRTIASETRLRLLWEIFKHNNLCIADLARIIGISEQNASTQLRILSSRGLILPVRKNLRIIYQPEANSELEHAGTLLEALRKSFENEMPFETVVQQATAFTHARRIQIAQTLAEAPLTFGDLLEKTGMSTNSLALHLNKLEARRFVRKKGSRYQLARPGNSLGQMLIEIACA